MKKIIVKNGKIPKIADNVACIGYFDGVHRGHQALIKVAKDLSRMNGLKSMVICFNPDPNDIIFKKRNKHIHSYSDRLDYFEEMGVDIVCVVEFTEELMKLEPEVFIEEFLMKMNINTLVCGYDFSFGNMGKGNSELLSSNLNTVVVEEVSYYKKKISSTRIKEAIQKGNYRLVNNLLGHNYRLKLKVIGYENGRYKCECIDDSLLLPKKYDNGTLSYRDGYFYLKSKEKLETGSTFPYKFLD